MRVVRYYVGGKCTFVGAMCQHVRFRYYFSTIQTVSNYLEKHEIRTLSLIHGDHVKVVTINGGSSEKLNLKFIKEGHRCRFTSRKEFSLTRKTQILVFKQTSKWKAQFLNQSMVSPENGKI